jgi:hypothetical protein
MRAEVSFLFRLGLGANDAHIGSGVYLQVFNESQRNWLWGLRESDNRLNARAELDESYNSRLYISLDDITDNQDPLYEDPRIKQAQELIVRAIVLSRIIQPTPIATGSPWIKSFYPNPDPPYHRSEVSIGPYSRAYTSPEHSNLAITLKTAHMAELWANYQYLFDHEEKYRRIIRALKYFDAGYHLWHAEFRHMVFYAALESLICTSHDSIKAQFAQRLPGKQRIATRWLQTIKSEPMQLYGRKHRYSHCSNGPYLTKRLPICWLTGESLRANIW